MNQASVIVNGIPQVAQAVGMHDSTAGSRTLSFIIGLGKTLVDLITKISKIL